MENDPETALRWYDESMRVSQAVGYQDGIAAVEHEKARIAARRGEFVKAEKGKDGDALTLDLYYTYMSAGQKIGQLQRLVWTKTAHYSVVFGCLADG